MFAHVAEGHGTVVWEVFLYEHVTIEAAHLGDGEYTDATERTCTYVEHLSLGNVRALTHPRSHTAHGRR